MYTDYITNKLIDWRWRGQAVPTLTSPHYIGLIMATRGLSSGIRSAAVSSGDTVLPATPNGRIYKCTTGGTTGAGEPSWGTTDGGTTSDGGTVVWTEQTTAMKAGTFTEAAYGSYARVSHALSAANMSSTGGATTTTNPSVGTSGQTSNNAAIAFPAPTTGTGSIFGCFVADASTAGNIWEFFANTTPLAISSGGSAPTLPISSMVLTPFN